MANKRLAEFSDDEFQAHVEQKRRDRMTRIDSMPPEMRALVYKYGLPVVDTCIALGVKKPRQITHIVETILDEFSPTRGAYSKQGIRSHVERADG